MCGCYAVLSDISMIARMFDIRAIDEEYRRGSSIFPGQRVSAVIRRDGVNKLVSFQWGLIPAWAKDPAMGRRMFNARAETVAEKPSFREAFRKRRCLIITDGFYEWQKIGGKKKPYLLSLKSGEPFALAGLYETWVSPEGKIVNTCTIITTDSNDLIQPMHDRMPVIVPKDKEALWLDPRVQNPKEPLSVLKPYPTDEMTMSEMTDQDSRG